MVTCKKKTVHVHSSESVPNGTTHPNTTQYYSVWDRPQWRTNILNLHGSRCLQAETNNPSNEKVTEK